MGAADKMPFIIWPAENFDDEDVYEWPVKQANNYILESTVIDFKRYIWAF